MLVKSMTHEEAANEARRDLKSVARKVVYHSEDIMKKMKKVKQKSFNKLFDYKSPRGNNWFYVLKITGSSHRKLQFSGYFVCWHIADKGIRAMSVYNDAITNATIVKIYTSHVFDRYKERFGIQGIMDGKLDMIKEYIKRNGNPLMAEENSTADKITIMCNNKDSMELGNMTRSTNIVVINTFVTPNMLMGNQKIMRGIYDALRDGDVEEYEKLKKSITDTDGIELIETD